MTNYERDAQSSTTIKENFALQVFELGIILKEVFLNVNRVQRQVNGARTRQYPLAKTTQASTSSDVIHRHDLPSFIEELGWQLTSSCSDFMEWVKVSTQEVCDWSFTVYLNNWKISKETLGR